MPRISLEYNQKEHRMETIIWFFNNNESTGEVIHSPMWW